MGGSNGAKGDGFPYPGIPTTSDGAGMVAWVEPHITQGACAFPMANYYRAVLGYA